MSTLDTGRSFCYGHLAASIYVNYLRSPVGGNHEVRANINAGSAQRILASSSFLCQRAPQIGNELLDNANSRGACHGEPKADNSVSSGTPARRLPEARQESFCGHSAQLRYRDIPTAVIVVLRRSAVRSLSSPEQPHTEAASAPQAQGRAPRKVLERQRLRQVTGVKWSPWLGD